MGLRAPAERCALQQRPALLGRLPYPTGGTARFFGPLSCNDFLKASSIVRYDAAALAADACDVMDFANREGLDAHARAIEIRLAEKTTKGKTSAE